MTLLIGTTSLQLARLAGGDVALLLASHGLTLAFRMSEAQRVELAAELYGYGMPEDHLHEAPSRRVRPLHIITAHDGAG